MTLQVQGGLCSENCRVGLRRLTDPGIWRRTETYGARSGFWTGKSGTVGLLGFATGHGPDSKAAILGLRFRACLRIRERDGVLLLLRRSFPQPLRTKTSWN